MNLRFIFLGTPRFAAIVLEGLIREGMSPMLVITNPDRPVGRKKIITPPPTKIIAQNNAIPVWQPETLNIKEYKERTQGADVAVVAAYAKILKPDIIAVPRCGTIGVHPSLLPRHRGASPLQTTILEGDRETGMTLFVIDEQVDHGPIIAQEKLDEYRPDTTTYETLEESLAYLGATMILKTLPLYCHGSIPLQPQDESRATYTKKFKTEDGYVDITKDNPTSILRKIRALGKEPGVYTIQNNKRMKILEADVENGKLVLKKIQFEGEKPKTI